MKIIGTKQRMTQLFDDKGVVRGATVITVRQPAESELVVGDKVAVESRRVRGSKGW